MNTTFIIPIRLESPDRARNIIASVRYLLKNTKSQIIIKEVDVSQKIPDLLKAEIYDERVTYLFETYRGIFHRTKYLNDMLELVTTPVVCNYDADVILPPSSYSESERLILENTADVVYPYPDDITGQIQLFFTGKNEESKFIEESNFELLNHFDRSYCRAHAGFCFFVSREKYKSVGAEVEYFVSYGPEDGERIVRFEKLGLRIARLQDRVYHMEHQRTFDSNDRNPHFQRNWDLFEVLTKMNAEDMKNMLRTSDYLKNRNWSSLI